MLPVPLIFGSVLLSAAGLLAAAEPSPEQVQFFEQKIRPVLVDHCYECHSTQAKKVKGGLLLDTRAGWEKGGDSGEAAIVPGEPERSPLIQAVRHDDPDTAMPPKKPKLDAAILADLVQWVKMGAPDPRVAAAGEAKRGDKSWWSLQPLAASEPPSPAGLPDAWAVNPIDRFIFAKLAEKNLQPSPPAAPRDYIRRLTYDLTGLPPKPEEVEEFARDFASGEQAAGERLVDRLLASPHYGEQWGRHWLDVVRFGESNGFERNFIIENAWPFRDYVLRSFNEDKPFNQFIVEHLAGDVVARGRPDDEVGVAFLTIGPYDDVGNKDPVAQANIRAATVDDMVTATGSAFLGLTINCARCHNHKFDPVPTEDYYRIKSAFDGVTHGPRVLATDEARAAHDAAAGPLEKQRAELTEAKASLEKEIVKRAPPVPATRPAASAHLTEEKFAPVEARQVRLTILASSNAKGPIQGAGARIDEFEVWTAGEASRNVALASAGGKAEGAAGQEARDFAGAYSVSRVNDGKFSERWFVGSPAELTITFAQAETIDRVTFSHDRASLSEKPIEGLGPCVAEYEIHISTDGKTWVKVADSSDRAPFTEAHAKARQLRTNATPEERARLVELADQLAAVNATLAGIPPLPLVWAGKFAQPAKPTLVFKGGDPARPGDEVRPASLAVLDQAAPHYELPGDAPESERRLALAKWIASDENPLTARVLVNRLWHYHFGTGIVETPGDFGFLGSRPTHPELLDWLARRLQQHGWHVKALQREIVLSQTYRQSGAFREEAARADKDARLLWRFPPRRLAAEELRDTMLCVAGRLEERMGGPGFRLYDMKVDNVSTYTPLDRPAPETYRRSVYHQNPRASVIDILTDFDLPDTASSAPRRANTTTPLQTLTLLNSPFTIDLSAALAERLQREAGPDVEAQVARGFALAFQRSPAASETEAAVRLVREHGLTAFCRALFNANELLYLF